MRTHHTFQKNPKFLHQKVWTSASKEPPIARKTLHWTSEQPLSPLIADVFYGKPLFAKTYMSGNISLKSDIANFNLNFVFLH